MRIDGISSNAGAAAKAMKKPHPVKDEKPVETTATATAQETESGEKTRGVIRLLQAGHFKGVADVRLRINFYDEIQALESQNLKTVAAGGFESLNQTVQDQITALKDSGLLNEEQTTALDDFLASLQEAQNESLNGDGISVQELIDSFRAKLESLMALLNPPAPAIPAAAQEPEVPAEPAVVPEEPTIPAEPQAAGPEEPIEPAAVPQEPVEPAAVPQESIEPAEPQAAPEEIPVAGIEEQQPPVEEAPVPVPVIPVEPQPAEPSPLQLLVANFQESVQQAIDGLQSGMTSSSALPPLSEPSGNGKAYAKFLAIYESMQAGAAPETPPAQPLVPVPESPAPEEVVVEEDVVVEEPEPEPLSEFV